MSVEYIQKEMSRGSKWVTKYQVNTRKCNKGGDEGEEMLQDIQKTNNKVAIVWSSLLVIILNVNECNSQTRHRLGEWGKKQDQPKYTLQEIYFSFRVHLSWMWNDWKGIQWK